MATAIFLNGRFVEPHEAQVSALDAGLQHAVGLFETFSARYNPALPPDPDLGTPVPGVRVTHLAQHLRRLAASAKALGLSEDLRTSALAEAVVRTVARAGDDAAHVADELGDDSLHLRVRVTITGGDLSMLAGAPGRGDAGGPNEGTPHQPTVLIVAQRAPRYPEAFFEKGVLATIADWKANPLDPFQGHKTLTYWPRLRELQRAASRRAGEALVFMVTNHLAGGCVSNAILFKNGQGQTPIARGEEAGSTADDPGIDPDASPDPSADPSRDPEGVTTSPAPAAAAGVLPSCVLPGVTRAWALRTLEARGIHVRRRMVTIADILDADEIVLTNSSWGVLPAVRVEERTIGSGEVGPIAKGLIRAWRDEARPATEAR